jgi:regulator of protease activity HflC (stomatin/prohibitin superfamily)
MEGLSVGTISTLVVAIFIIVTLFKGVYTVDQSNEYVVERFGKYRTTLTAGINIIIPYLDRVAHKVSVLERQLPSFYISVITRDNVEVNLESTVFFRITDPSKSVYRIRNVDQALQTTAESIVRSAAGKLDLDELQSSRSQMNQEILENLREAAEIWGVEITRSEITDVQVDEQTKQAQRQQLNAERERRATVARAEGEKRSIELQADAKLYEAQKVADAIRIKADADAYSVEIAAKAIAEQTRLIAAAINDNGQAAVQYDILQKQVDALSVMGSSPNSKTLVVPTDVTKTLGGLEIIKDMLKS